MRGSASDRRRGGAEARRAGRLDLWSRLGDPGAAAGAFLLAAAWALHEHEHEERPIELAAAGPGGEVAVALLGRIA